MRYAWVDLETSGLDPRVDVPFEIAVILTDDQLETISSLNLVVKYPDPKRVHIPMADEVRRMHTKNGLLGALVYGLPLVEVDVAVADFIKKNTSEGGAQFRLAGKGVKALDEPFLMKFFPKTYRLLNPKALDLNHVRWFIRDILGRRDLLWVPDLGRKAHRAMVDIADHVDEARYYKDLLGDALVAGS